jgi:dihydroorotate dehydrogenase (NAD+) catalytic subunit
MINAVGLANPGLDAVCREHLPWLASHLSETRKIANVVGFAVDDYPTVVAGLEAGLADGNASAIDAYELNVSCPNVKAGGMEFGADPLALRSVVERVRRETRRPVFVKIAVDAGADAISVVNTIPGLLIDVDRRRPALGFGTGGVSGPAILPVGVLATWHVRRAVRVPILGVGGVANGSDALQYIVAGASLVGIGTAALRDPRAPMRVVKEMAAWCDAHGVARISDLVGTLEGLT